MKIAAALLVGLLAYVVAASNGDEGVAGEEPVANHQVILRPTTRAPLRTYQPRRIYRRPTTVVRRTPRRRGIFGNIDLSSLALVMFFSRFLSRTTTEAPITTTTMGDVTTAGDVTTVTEATTTTTEDPFEGWKTSGTCRYFKSAETKTSTAATADCEDRVTGATLVSAALNQPALLREEFIDELGLTSISYWIGATATGTGAEGGDVSATDAWVLTGKPSTAPIDPLTVTDVDGAATTDTICGRFPAGSSPTEVLFEDCADEKFFYVCEYCGTV